MSRIDTLTDARVHRLARRLHKLLDARRNLRRALFDAVKGAEREIEAERTRKAMEREHA